MATKKRPYFAVYAGKQYMVEAPGPGAAIAHIVSDQITELRAASASEVLAWARRGNPVEIAGEKVEVEPAADEKIGAAVTVLDPLLPMAMPLNWSKEAAFAFLNAEGDFTELANDRLHKVYATDRLTLEDFDVIRQEAPFFSTMICQHGYRGLRTVDEVRAALEEAPLAAGDVDIAIAQLYLNATTSVASPVAE